MQNPDEMWQAKVNGEVYDASFGELTLWVSESSLLESDKVRRGKLRWLEAGKVPQLRDFFNAKANGTEPPYVHVTTTDGTNHPPTMQDGVEEVSSTQNFPDNQFQSNANKIESTQNFANQNQHSQIDESFMATVCEMHPESPAHYICQACSHGFCNSCPQSFGSNVKICPYCGAMCKDINEFQVENERELKYQKDISAGFGFDDFLKALAYPFKFKFSLFAGGLIVALLGIGQAAASYASMFLVGAAIICLMLANSISFGVLANTIESFSQGNIGKDFMPSFDDFSLWDDVVHPFFLSIGVYISSFGLVFLVVIGTAWYAWNSITNQINTPAQTPYASIPKSQQTQDHIKKVLEKYKKQNKGRTDVKIGEDGLTVGQRDSLKEEAYFNEVNDLANNVRKDQLAATIGKSAADEQKDRQAIMSKLFKAAGFFLFFGVIGLLWGIFYFPAAVCVAGYTRSFTATLNPLVGLDTIKHLGFDYVKIWFMYLFIGFISLVSGVILAIVFSPFDMPKFGNLPASFFGSFVSFYLTAVFAVTLGLALYKNSDKLQLYRGNK